MIAFLVIPCALLRTSKGVVTRSLTTLRCVVQYSASSAACRLHPCVGPRHVLLLTDMHRVSESNYGDAYFPNRVRKVLDSRVIPILRRLETN